MKRKKIFDKLPISWRSFVCFFWGSVFIGILLFLLLFYLASNNYLGALPNTDDIENPSMSVGSDIYDANGKLLGRFFSENRTLISYNQLPKHLINALLAKEDIRFRKHPGIDGKSILRAVFFLGLKGGGSTLTQQLAKLLFTGRSSRNKFERVKQKLLEWITAIELERRYSKEEIMAMYLNKFDFLYNAKGIATASFTYFNKNASELSLLESATLIAMLENPSYYNPKIYPKHAKIKRNVVLYQMKRYGFIDDKTYKEERKKDIELHFKLQKENFNLLTHYREHLKKEVQKALDEYEERTNIKLNVNTSGLKIYTSIDSKMQEYAHEAIKKHLKKLQPLFDDSQKNNKNAPFLGISAKKREDILLESMYNTTLYKELEKKGLTREMIIKEFKKPRKIKLFTWEGPKEKWISPWDVLAYRKGIVQAGLLSIEPSTGLIKAWVGGVDFNYFQYDHVAQTKRQVGSVFKPILYASAIKELHYNPCTKISNERFTQGNWSPRNVGNLYGGEISLRDALAKSVNTISARLISKIGPRSVINLAKDMGIKSFIPYNLSISLGSADLTLYEMTAAFNTFANYGSYAKPILLMKIEDRTGKVIKEYKPSVHEVLDKQIAQVMLDLMKNVVENGTARAIKNYGIRAEVAGKTGTTNDHADGWFIGMTPLLTTGIWVGWENRFSHFNSLSLGQGARMALPIWAYYMSDILKDKSLNHSPNEKFNIPERIRSQWEDCNSEASLENIFIEGGKKPNDEESRKNRINYDD